MRSDSPHAAEDAATEKREASKRHQQEIDQLAAQIDQLRIDYQRFFAGDLPLPPHELQREVQKAIRRLRGDSLVGAAERFRLGALEARLNSHLELSNRRLREREAGLQKIRAHPSESKPDARQGVVLGPEARAGAVEALYRGLYDGRPTASMDIDRFRSYIGRQAEQIRSKTGCREILFRVATEDGKMKIKAKPIRGKASP